MPRMGRLSLVHIVLLAVSFATASFARNASITANNSQAVEQSEAAANHSIGESNEKGIFCAGGFCDVSGLCYNRHPYTCTPSNLEYSSLCTYCQSLPTLCLSTPVLRTLSHALSLNHAVARYICLTRCCAVSVAFSRIFRCSC